jgi:zinc/manganese transport system ATP-binding protein
MAEMILEVSHLTICREGSTVVDDVSFTLEAESDTALVGPNGAGKSTLVQAILGVLPRRTGDVRVLGHALGPRGQLPPAVRDQVAYLPQSIALHGRFPLSVAEFVGLGWDRAALALPWRGGRARRAAVALALAKVGGEDLAMGLATVYRHLRQRPAQAHPAGLLRGAAAPAAGAR